jgi:hypothetical protein
MAAQQWLAKEPGNRGYQGVTVGRLEGWSDVSLLKIPTQLLERRWDLRTVRRDYANAQSLKPDRGPLDPYFKDIPDWRVGEETHSRPSNSNLEDIHKCKYKYE